MLENTVGARPLQNRPPRAARALEEVAVGRVGRPDARVGAAAAAVEARRRRRRGGRAEDRRAVEERVEAGPARAARAEAVGDDVERLARELEADVEVGDLVREVSEVPARERLRKINPRRERRDVGTAGTRWPARGGARARPAGGRPRRR